MNTPIVPRMLCHVLAACVLLPSLHAQKRLLEPDSGPPRINHPLPDGSVTPQPVKPVFTVAPAKVLQTRTHSHDGRSIVVQRIEPLALPAARVPAPPDLDHPVSQERLAEWREERPEPSAAFLFAGATVFRTQDGDARTLVRLRPQEKPEVVFWSSADFDLLSGVASFTATDGRAHSLLLLWNTVEVAGFADLETPGTLAEGISPPPDFPAGEAGFVVIGGQPDEATLVSLHSLHELYDLERSRLAAAAMGRRQAAAAKAARLAADPPEKKNLTLRYWRIDSPEQSSTGKAGAR